MIHGFGECDITSSLHAQGKLSILKLLEKSKAGRGKTDVFLQKGRTPEAICERGIKIFTLFCCGKDPDSLTDLRYLKYMSLKYKT